MVPRPKLMMPCRRDAGLELKINGPAPDLATVANPEANIGVYVVKAIADLERSAKGPRIDLTAGETDTYGWCDVEIGACCIDPKT